MCAPRVSFWSLASAGASADPLRPDTPSPEGAIQGRLNRPCLVRRMAWLPGCPALRACRQAKAEPARNADKRNPNGFSLATVGRHNVGRADPQGLSTNGPFQIEDNLPGCGFPGGQT
jgi:hypothetical protein